MADYIYTNVLKNINYLKSTYHTDICTDIVVRDFQILVNNFRYKAFIIYI